MEQGKAGPLAFFVQLGQTSLVRRLLQRHRRVCFLVLVSFVCGSPLVFWLRSIGATNYSLSLTEVDRNQKLEVDRKQKAESLSQNAEVEVDRNQKVEVQVDRNQKMEVDRNQKVEVDRKRKLEVEVDRNQTLEAEVDFIRKKEGCKCEVDDLKAPVRLSTLKDAKAAANLRNSRYPYVKELFEAVRAEKARLMLRDGTLMAVLREGGWTPYDCDFDVLLAADSEEAGITMLNKVFGRLNIRQEKGRSKIPHGWKMARPDRGEFFGLKLWNFAIWHTAINQWPVVDGLIIPAAPTGDQSILADKLVLHHGGNESGGYFPYLPPKYFPKTFEDLQWVLFYDAQVPVMPKADEFLDELYLTPKGSPNNWRCVAMNKCNSPLGSLFKQDREKCGWPLYLGGKSYPYRTCGMATRRGPLDWAESREKSKLESEWYLEVVPSK